MPRMKTALTARGLRTQEQRINNEITCYNLALDRLETAGINNTNRNISDKFTPLERGIYNSILARLDTALKKRRELHKVMHQIGMHTLPAALDNRR